MLCVICGQAKLVEAFTSIPLEHDEIRILINNVPAKACPKCGDAVVMEDIAVQLLRFGNELSNAGVIESMQDFQRLWLER